MGKRPAHRSRPQAQKDRAVTRVQELRRSNAAQPERNRARYSRSDVRNTVQRNGWGD